ncbi:Glycosyltransferase, GT2 family [Yoonia litorea]|uniref:Glycosyltransferase, GT2 family n=2 Tax=Yoonia litorea TaxID=1123755 RepID=A0A1I6MW03_9RHOB|nr:Glycosyltransferase, GT2 family [Yoonia litorea]
MLLEAVHSVLGQSCPPTEVIIVDNGTVAADVEGLPKEVLYFRIAPRVGASIARNFGAAFSKGRFIAFLDDDDVWSSNFISDCLERLAQENAKCVYSSIFQMGPETPICLAQPSSENFTVKGLLRRNVGASGQNFVICKDLFWTVGGFDKDLVVSEDRDLGIRVILSGAKIRFSTKAKVFMRPSDGRERLTSHHPRRFALLWKYKSYLGLKDVLILSVVFSASQIKRQLAKVVLRYPFGATKF